MYHLRFHLHFKFNLHIGLEWEESSPVEGLDRLLKNVWTQVAGLVRTNEGAYNSSVGFNNDTLQCVKSFWCSFQLCPFPKGVLIKCFSRSHVKREGENAPSPAHLRLRWSCAGLICWSLKFRVSLILARAAIGLLHPSYARRLWTWP